MSDETWEEYAERNGLASWTVRVGFFGKKQVNPHWVLWVNRGCPEHKPENPDNTVIKELAEALEFIAERQDLTFAECELAEQICDKASEALTKHAERIGKAQ